MGRPEFHRWHSTAIAYIRVEAVEFTVDGRIWKQLIRVESCHPGNHPVSLLPQHTRTLVDAIIAAEEQLTRWQSEREPAKKDFDRIGDREPEPENAGCSTLNVER